MILAGLLLVQYFIHTEADESPSPCPDPVMLQRSHEICNEHKWMRKKWRDRMNKGSCAKMII